MKDSVPKRTVFPSFGINARRTQHAGGNDKNLWHTYELHIVKQLGIFPCVFAMFNTELAAPWFWERQSFLSSKFDCPCLGGFYIASVYREFVFNVDTDESGGFLLKKNTVVLFPSIRLFFPSILTFSEERKSMVIRFKPSS